MAITESEKSTATGYKTVSAATVQPFVPTFPVIGADTGSIEISEDLLRDLAKKKGVLDTVYVTKTDTIKEQVTKVKVKKVSVPSNVMEINVTARTDTIQVPVYYLATQIESRTDSTGTCIPIYELRKVDELCPEIKNSSTKLVNEQDISVGE